MVHQTLVKYPAAENPRKNLQKYPISLVISDRKAENFIVEQKIKRDIKTTMELENTHKSDQEILILNHSQNETVGYPLVLLEGVISNNMSTVGPSRLLQMSTSETSKNLKSERGDKHQILDSASIKNTIQGHQDEWTLQIKTGNHQMTWPIVKGGFKVVVPLTTGENLVQLKVMDRADIHEFDLKLTYEPLTISR